MSEQNSGAFPFGELTGGEGLDINAIFGGVPNGAAPGDVNPFEAALAQQAAPAASIPQGQPQTTVMSAEQGQPSPRWTSTP